MPQHPHSEDEIVRRGEEIYNRELRARVEPQHRGKFLVVDIETGDYEIDVRDILAEQRLRARRPSGAFYLVRIGSPTAYRLGGRFRICVP